MCVCGYMKLSFEIRWRDLVLFLLLLIFLGIDEIVWR